MQVIVVALLALLVEGLVWDFAGFHLQFSALASMHRDLNSGLSLWAHPAKWSEWWQWPFPLAQVVLVITGSIGFVKSLSNRSGAKSARLLRLAGVIVIFMLVRAVIESVRAMQ